MNSQCSVTQRKTKKTTDEAEKQVKQRRIVVVLTECEDNQNKRRRRMSSGLHGGLICCLLHVSCLFLLLITALCFLNHSHIHSTGRAFSFLLLLLLGFCSHNPICLTSAPPSSSSSSSSSLRLRFTHPRYRLCSWSVSSFSIFVHLLSFWSSVLISLSVTPPFFSPFTFKLYSLFLFSI